MMDSRFQLIFAGKDLASGAVKSLHANMAGLHGMTGKLRGGLSDLAGGFTSLIPGPLAALAGIAGLAAGLGLAVKAGEEQQAGIAKLTTSLKDNVPAWDGNTAAIEAKISAQERLGFSDDEQRDSLTALVGATHDVKAAQDLQSQAMDLARYKGISLADATDDLIKVHSGNYKALKALGIILPATTSATDALAAVQKLSAGQAEAYGSTTAGAMAAVQAQVGELAGDVGSALLPILGDLAHFAVGTLIPALRDIGAKVMPVVATVAHALGVVFGWIGKVILPPLVAIIGTIVKVAFPPLAAAMGLFTDVIIPALGDAFSGVANVVGSVFGTISDVIKGVINTVIGLVNAVIGAIDAVQFHVDIQPPIGPEIKFGWDGLNISQLPYLATGGIITGSAIVGERGPELVEMAGNSARVRQSAPRGAQGAVAVHFHSTWPPTPAQAREVAAAVSRELYFRYRTGPITARPTGNG